MIVHFYDYKNIKNDVILNNSFFKLYNKFCPGPITFILKKKNKSKISSLVSANLDTVAIRFPNHNIIRSILKKTTVSKKIKNELMKPTRIYTKEIIKLCNKNLINSAAHITGGGLIENILRSVPKNRSININLSKLKITNIFKWIKKNNISDKEMVNTFNCGIGFCLIVSPKNVDKIKKFFTKQYEPYIIGNITKKKQNISGRLKW